MSGRIYGLDYYQRRRTSLRIGGDAGTQRVIAAPEGTKVILNRVSGSVFAVASGEDFVLTDGTNTIGQIDAGSLEQHRSQFDIAYNGFDTTSREVKVTTAVGTVEAAVTFDYYIVPEDLTL